MIRFKLHPPHAGWANVELEDNGQTMRVTGSYLTDCLRHLVDAVQSLATISTAECGWEQEPGKLNWHFRRSGDQLEVTVTDRGHNIAFRSSDNWGRFGLEVLKEFEKVLDEMGAESFHSEWRYPYPFDACDKLKTALPTVH